MHESLAALRGRWPGSEWTWETRLPCAVSSVATGLAPDARAALAVAFPSEWTAVSLAAAPEAVTALARRCGGLRDGQLLLCADAPDGALVFALWWPWGDGSKVSVRLGVASADPAGDFAARLRTGLGIA